MKLKIVTPEKTTYENDILQVSIPTLDGEITVMSNHVPLVSVLKAGELRIKDKDGEHVMAVSGGFLEVKANNELIILADNTERAGDIDLERAEQAKQRAKQEMAKAKELEDIDYAKLQAVIDREMNRIKVAKKYRKLPSSNHKT